MHMVPMGKQQRPFVTSIAAPFRNFILMQHVDTRVSHHTRMTNTPASPNLHLGAYRVI